MQRGLLRAGGGEARYGVVVVRHDAKAQLLAAACERSLEGSGIVVHSTAAECELCAAINLMRQAAGGGVLAAASPTPASGGWWREGGASPIPLDVLPAPVDPAARAEAAALVEAAREGGRLAAHAASTDAEVIAERRVHEAHAAMARAETSRRAKLWATPS